MRTDNDGHYVVAIHHLSLRRYLKIKFSSNTVMLKVFSRAFEFGKNYIWDRLVGWVGGVGLAKLAIYTLILNERTSPWSPSYSLLSLSLTLSFKNQQNR